MKNFKKLLPWILVILWMVLIFYLSHQPATRSDELSIGVTETIIKAVSKIVPDIEWDIRNFNHIIRKNAHFFIYLGLGVLVVNALKSSGLGGYRCIGIAFIICLLYAIGDEVHQLFIPGRAGQIRDVLIDSAGAIIGILIYNYSNNRNISI